ncbi:TPA: tyrosine-type recombinase/integrase [Vibrio metschnikovii]|uniref:tyrosine-type recombinase/integrase n=1 Tax=Vibrio TaxID=662 RepID=UPI00137336D7|nr:MULTISPECIES: tyrosine-type recombinase/integrase [Vibrio]MBC3620109.1 tyrosine-type recombinase/integrase [Vibrio metschnikovii]NAW63447.1 tyrosine-type recombinase/integrase [Vibrio sp. V31_P5A7T61]NAX01065.1 tyrosine-type recombinase/integrase [Vibrio sp. V34_P3A8T189]NAX08377.1 tyrosine-type recombinase/integrase [Vibrio sp. V40_P2S30T141]NAX64975.1 tyrosine-type recombinase/integrase [Vibrio sp. V32_P6A28T40]
MVTTNKQRRHLGQKKPFKLEDIWRIRTRLEIEGNLMELALLNLAIDSKLRSCDLLRIRVCDISSTGIIHPRILFTQSKTQRDVQFEITAKTQHALSQWLFVSQLSPQDFIFPSPRKTGVPMSYSFYAHIIKKWATTLGLDAAQYGTHSMRRTKATLIYARTKNIRAVQLLLGHVKLDNTIRYLGVEIEDALKISEDTDI